MKMNKVTEDNAPRASHHKADLSRMIQFVLPNLSRTETIPPMQQLPGYPVIHGEAIMHKKLSIYVRGVKNVLWRAKAGAKSFAGCQWRGGQEHCDPHVDR